MHRTASVCPVCLKPIPAVRVEWDGRYFQEKTCPEHGDFSTLVWQGSQALEDWTGPREETWAVPRTAACAETTCGPPAAPCWR